MLPAHLVEFRTGLNQHHFLAAYEVDAAFDERRGHRQAGCRAGGPSEHEVLDYAI